jgi:GNAT superfamily N-acetyltransferase
MITVSTDKNKLDITFIHNFLKDSYWAKDRTIEIVKISIENSLCFGIYLDNEQIGFARVVTDFAIFAYLMDVFIIEKHRGKGYSTILIDSMLTNSKLKSIKQWGLVTLDAHFLYKKFGFISVGNPEKLMERILK